MRTPEYCGLELDDIVADNGALPYFHIGCNELRLLQNHRSIRNLCIHPELIRLGFLDYVKVLRDISFGQLFPDIHGDSSSSASLGGDRLYTELAPTIERLGLTLHQFRQFFHDELADKQVADEFLKNLMGVEGASDTAMRHCDPVIIEQQLVALSRIEVCTAHLKPVPIRLLPWVEAKQSAPWVRRKRLKTQS